MYGVVHKIHRDLLTLLNSFLSVNEKEKFFRKRSCRDVCKKKALSGVCSSGVRLPNEKPAKISLQTNRRSQKTRFLRKVFPQHLNHTTFSI